MSLRPLAAQWPPAHGVASFQMLDLDGLRLLLYVTPASLYSVKSPPQSCHRTALDKAKKNVLFKKSSLLCKSLTFKANFASADRLAGEKATQTAAMNMQQSHPLINGAARPVCLTRL